MTRTVGKRIFNFVNVVKKEPKMSNIAKKEAET